MNVRIYTTSLVAGTVRARFTDFVELTKPRITLLVVITTLVGFKLATSLTPMAAGSTTLAAGVWLLLSTLAGTGLVAAGASALNQLLEREVDGRMLRTRERPLPSGRLSTDEALVFGVVLSLIGILWLSVFTSLLAGIIATATLVLYAFVYTPLKRITPLCTVIGAVPGALPPVIGWAAARGELDPGAWALFAIMFVWQLPHFFAIAWIHREDYARGGLPMLPVVDHDGTITSRHIAATSAALLPISLAPVLLGLAGGLYFLGAALMGLGFLVLGFRVALTRLEAHARLLFLGSILYLPALLGLMMIDHMWF